MKAPKDFTQKHNPETCVYCSSERNKEKITMIELAIKNNHFIKFDYVAKDLSIKFGKLVKPLEIHDHMLAGTDMEKGQFRQYILDGIQGGEPIGTCLDKNDVEYALNANAFKDWQTSDAIDNDLPF